ncbi:Mu-like prophage major head subunit gpT family protein [Sediminicoccus sp. KRV36]|uniref:Mu-like prophage major head subunit gpT family protein n=1 Tax=Sediminicoccus sp. KRV36 TaxID=3133721 RepID=UPI00200F3B91|nr:Mu-like prophage major head subunit gpT family protein [Sediminicoccus rosea]UPY36211.1 Mu-like prophage major head subunit gpT family protein [Sediminicoccus rosea]
MTPNAEGLSTLFQGYTAVFNKALGEAPSYYQKTSMVIPSITRENQYGWLAALPSMREWVGDRVIHQLAIEGFKIVNRDWEATVAVKRTDIEDDQYGVYGPLFDKMGRDAAVHPDELTLGLLGQGFTTACYDKQFFFDVDHPVGGAGDTPVTAVSNFGGGAGTPWYLLDCSQAIKPLVFQRRMAPQLDELDARTQERVFLKNEFLYGVRSRCNAGYGLWQLAYGSRQPLNAANYALARAAMQNFRGDNGKPLNVRPTHLVVPPSLEADGLTVVNADRNAAGAANIWAGTASLICTPFVA